MPGPGPIINEQCLDVTSDLNVLSDVRRFLRDVFAGIADDPVNRMELAANEVAANIIRHAYKGAPGHAIVIRAQVGPDRICVSFFDHGAPFDPEQVPAPLFDGSQEGGFGLFIVSEVVDEFRYLPSAEGNRTTLCIFLP
ncbi:ATP-binding protein [Desulfoluna butyratoxydans]|uniref:Histidine kinase-like atpase c-terminal domain n=1 Tax=Desulfoluna butyratoxydans TaxID=231438 RepID=A0A4U8YWV0_9BACT|nr:ATP-binding protein [Desulfoluna butyratoxydans]VFQ46502.1 histidine kinase-like atpase c-terminal domain [Desulfoluna butyratoxydans]